MSDEDTADALLVGGLAHGQHVTVRYPTPLEHIIPVPGTIPANEWNQALENGGTVQMTYQVYRNQGPVGHGRYYFLYSHDDTLETRPRGEPR